MKINIEDHRKWVYALLERANIPLRFKDDVYQDFCVYYYSRNTEYNPEYKATTWIGLLFKSFLSHRAARYGMKKRQGELVGIDAIAENGYTPDLEASIDIDRLYPKLPELFKTLLNTQHTSATIAKANGVTRQAVEAKLKTQMKKAIKDYEEDYNV